MKDLKQHFKEKEIKITLNMLKDTNIKNKKKNESNHVRDVDRKYNGRGQYTW